MALSLYFGGVKKRPELPPDGACTAGWHVPCAQARVFMQDWIDILTIIMHMGRHRPLTTSAMSPQGLSITTLSIDIHIDTPFERSVFRSLPRIKRLIIECIEPEGHGRQILLEAAHLSTITSSLAYLSL